MQTGQQHLAPCLQTKALAKTKTFADVLEKRGRTEEQPEEME